MTKLLSNFRRLKFNNRTSMMAWNIHIVIVLFTALFLNEIYLPMKVQVSSLNTPEKSKNENEQRAITPKVWNLELWFLCTALLLNALYALHSFKVIFQTKKGRTDGRTDKITYALEPHNVVIHSGSFFCLHWGCSPSVI